MMKNFDKLIENVVRSVLSEAGFDNNAYRRDKYATDAEYREKIKARSRAYVPSREVRDRRNAKARKKTAIDSAMADYKIPYEDAWNDVDGVDIETVPMQDKNISGFEDKDYYTNLFKYLMRDLTDNEKWVITKKFGLDGEEPLDGEELRIAYNQKFGTNYKHYERMRAICQHALRVMRDNGGNILGESKQMINESVVAILLMWAVAKAIKKPNMIKHIVNKIVSNGAVEKAIPFVQNKINEYVGNEEVRSALQTLLKELKKYIDNNKGMN